MSEPLLAACRAWARWVSFRKGSSELRDILYVRWNIEAGEPIMTQFCKTCKVGPRYPIREHSRSSANKTGQLAAPRLVLG